MIRYQAAGLLVVLGCLAGCVDVNGGAVELRWEIRDINGHGVTCADSGLEQVRLRAIPVDGGGDVKCEGGERCKIFACAAYYGSTAFEIPAGRYSLAIEVVCPVDVDASVAEGPSASVPAPIIRDISNGNVAELNTLLIEKQFLNQTICPTNLKRLAGRP